MYRFYQVMARLPLSLHFTHIQLLPADQLFHQTTYRLGVAEQHLLFSISF